MAQAASFDITSTVDLQEVDNAVNQARKEVAQRYDFKGSRAAIELNQNCLLYTSPSPRDGLLSRMPSSA